MMNRSMGKARSSRKQRLDGARKGRPARPNNRVSRIVRARGAGGAVPANDTALELDAPANQVTGAPEAGAPGIDVELGEQSLIGEDAGRTDDSEIAPPGEAPIDPAHGAA